MKEMDNFYRVQKYFLQNQGLSELIFLYSNTTTLTNY